jgi:hypothetical protein
MQKLSNFIGRLNEKGCRGIPRRGRKGCPLELTHSPFSEATRRCGPTNTFLQQP